jgi:hypothetical protein
MSENEKFPHTNGIWNNASQARDIQLALMFELATTAFVEGWEALRLRTSSVTPTGACDDKPAAALAQESVQESAQESAQDKADAAES